MKGLISLGKIDDLTGQRFGRLVALNKATDRISSTGYYYTVWNCQCDCGKTKGVLASYLKRATTQSCGCLAKENTARRSTKDLTGKRFGRLLVLGKSPTKRYNNLDWLCQCDCGQQTCVCGSNLTSGNTCSCGCYNREQTSHANQLLGTTAAYNSLFRSYQRKADKRGIGFYLSKEEFKLLTQSNCFYCGNKPANIQRSCSSAEDYIYNGIDRVDNTKDYTLDNCVSCCKICNRAKGDLSIKQFYEWLYKIITYKDVS